MYVLYISYINLLNKLQQARTHLLLEKSLGLVVTGLKLSSLPLMGPVRKLILELIEIIEPASSL